MERTLLETRVVKNEAIVGFDWGRLVSLLGPG
jgi:hypothetical protein